jgi:hypothetical protein
MTRTPHELAVEFEELLEAIKRLADREIDGLLIKFQQAEMLLEALRAQKPVETDDLKEDMEKAYKIRVAPREPYNEEYLAIYWTLYWLSTKGYLAPQKPVDVDALAQFIRIHDGDGDLGAGNLAELIATKYNLTEKE